MDNDYFSTKDVSQMLGVTLDALKRAIFLSRVIAPRKVGGNYVWLRSDIEAASWVLRRRSADDLFTGRML